MAFYQLKKTQLLHTSVDDVWSFISDPGNLTKITPDDMGFDIQTTELPEQMYPGMMIHYRVSPLLGIGLNWVTEITHIVDKKYFVDEQRIGPYSLWHHEHRIHSHPEGVLMEDIVSYQPPFGILGRALHPLLIRPRLEEIFNYRKLVLDKVFNHLPA